MKGAIQINHQELYTGLRELIGQPDPNQVTNRQLDIHIASALEWLAVQLKYGVVHEDNFLIQAETQEYPVPRDMAWMISVGWNQQKLSPTTTYRLDREQTNWTYASSGNPTEFAFVQGGRNLILNPKPSAAAVSTAPSLQLRYISSSPGTDSAGTPQLGDLDQEIALYRAAMRYLRAHITKDNAEEYNLKIQHYQAETLDLVDAAKRRAQNPIEDYYPKFEVHTDRMGAAR